MGMSMLLAEDLLLLLLDDETGKLDTTYLDSALGGSMLLELAGAELLEVHKQGKWSQAKVYVLTDGKPPTDSILAESLELVREKERTAQDLVDRLAKGLKGKLLAKLGERGIVHHEEGRILGIFPTNRWPAVDSSHEVEVRRQLEAALLQGVTPDERTAALVSLLHATDRAHTVLADNQGVSNRQIKARAKEIAEGEWASKAVKDAIAAANAAMMAVITTTVITAST